MATRRPHLTIHLAMSLIANLQVVPNVYSLNFMKLCQSVGCYKPCGKPFSVCPNWNFVCHVLHMVLYCMYVLQQGVFRDDTAANYVKFKCRDLAHSSNAYELVKPPGYGLWGEYGGWSAKCPQNTAICGLRTKIEQRQKLFIDNTALNEVDFYCCE